MSARVRIDQDETVCGFVERVNSARDDATARIAYRESFGRLRSQLSLYPPATARASVVFESAAATVRALAAHCLPLSVAIAMHLYPLCALQCMPLPLMHAARFKRAMLLRAIRHRSLILANAGSERTRGPDEALVATPGGDGIMIDGACEYMSLSSVADLVLCKARLASTDCTIVFAADLKADSVHIGDWKFGGRMRMSDTASVRFIRHHVPQGRYVQMRDATGVQHVSDYQRCWFHVFLAEIHLARMERLREIWPLPDDISYRIGRNESLRLREYSLQLLDDFPATRGIDALVRTTSALKLRVSLMSQSMGAALRSMDDESASLDAAELAHIRFQPTADERILRSLGIGT